MNREIKFRAWNKFSNKWVEFHSKDDIDCIGYGQTAFYLITDEAPRDYIWSQFTGLLDKNGKEIYEGDIVGYWGGNPNGSKWIVGWDENKSGWAAVYGQDERTSSGISIAHQPAFKLSKKLCEKKEVIGNIFENPELLSN